MRAFVRAALIAGFALSGSVARAGAPSWTLAWQAPSACPSEREVRSKVERWLAQAHPGAPIGIAVNARVRREPEGFVLELELVTPSGRARERLVAERCETLAGVVALKVALAADPTAGLAAPDPEPDALRAGLRLSGGAGSGAVPDFAPLLAVTGTLRYARVGFELGAGYVFAKEARYPQLRAVGADIDLLWASARLCVVPDLGRAELPFCGGADLGLMRGRGFGVEDVSTTTQPYAALVVGPALRWPFAPELVGWLGFDALIAWLRPSFHMRNLETLHRAEPIGARVQLGLELQFE